MAVRDLHGYGFTRGFVATGPTVTGAVPDLDTRVQTAPVAAVSRYTVSDTVSSDTLRLKILGSLPFRSDTFPPEWPRNKRSRMVDPVPRDCQRLPVDLPKPDFNDAAASACLWGV
jgi:hypothetical protein